MNPTKKSELKTVTVGASYAQTGGVSNSGYMDSSDFHLSPGVTIQNLVTVFLVYVEGNIIPKQVVWQV